MQRRPALILARLALAIGFGLVAIPPLAKWYMSDYDRYIRLISGPWPFSHFSSAPVQLFFLGLLPLTLGLTLIIFAATVWRRLRRTAAGASLSLPYVLFTLLIAMVSSLMAGVVLMALVL